MTRIGMIPIENKHGVPCLVQYYYDQALDDYFLVPNKRFVSPPVKNGPTYHIFVDPPFDGKPTIIKGWR